jgi:hypothetical protein
MKMTIKMTRSTKNAAEAPLQNLSVLSIKAVLNET